MESDNLQAHLVGIIAVAVAASFMGGAALASA
jgi:hypothetical protein